MVVLRDSALDTFVSISHFSHTFPYLYYFMDNNSLDTLRRLQQNDDTLLNLYISQNHEHIHGGPNGVFNATNSEDYSQLGALIATNTILTKLYVCLSTTDINRRFYDALKQNSSISNLSIGCSGRGIIVGSVGHEALAAFQGNGNLTYLSIDGINEGNDVMQHGGMNVIISTLRSCVQLKSINLRFCGITDEHLIPMVDADRELQLESLWLYGNRIESVGCEALAKLLADPSSNIHTLHLGNNQIDTIGANTLFSGLKNNTKLKILYLAGNPVSGKDVKDILSRILCNTTSINDIYSSNHTLENLSINGDRGVELRSLLDLNRGENKSHVATMKILQYHPNIDMSPLFKLDSEGEQNIKGLPYVVDWFERAKEVVATVFLRSGRNIHAAEPEKSVKTKKLSAIYQFARSMPLMFVTSSHTKAGDKKRKREDNVDT